MIQVQKSHSGFVPSLAGVGGFVHQSGMASISDGERVRIVVEEVTGSVVLSWYIGGNGERFDVSDDVPARIRSNYDATVTFWSDAVQKWAPIPEFVA